MTDERPQVLIPFDQREAYSLKEAAGDAGRSVATLRSWVALHDLGRLVGGRWAVSKVAMAMHLNGDKAALRAYHAGDRESPLVADYFRRVGVPLPVGGRP